MIAIFDSGYGGLTVLKAMMKFLPEYDYLYLGDNARAPYGDNDGETIKLFTSQAVEYLFNSNVRIVITACNTVSGIALRHIQQKHVKSPEIEKKRVLGVIIPVAQYIAKHHKKEKIGVIGTKATIESGIFQEEINKLMPDIKIVAKACPLLAPLIEENWHKKPEGISIMKKYLRPLKNANINTLILGCTHYSFIIPQIKKIMRKNVKIIDPGEITAKSFKDYLERHPEIEKLLRKNKKREFLTTGDPQKFKLFAEKMLGTKIKLPGKIKLTPTQ